MPANRCNYVVVYDNLNQIYSASSEEIALNTPPPSGCLLKDKKVYFVMHEPDNKEIVWYRLDDELVQNAELKIPKSAKKKEEDELSQTANI